MIPITVVRCEEEELALVEEVIRSGMLAQGPMVERFEAACREMTGAAHAVAVNSGTTALVVALEALRLAPGSEVVTSPFTFVATLNAILEAGATARFADISEDDFNLDPTRLDGVVGDATAAIMPVHLYGQAADMDPIVRIATESGATVVEDAAQAHGATYGGRPVGTYGLATFSFYATKNLQCGEGGVVTTDDDELADRMRVLRNQGMRDRYQYEVPGHNYRLSDLAAAVAVPQFARLDAVVAARSANAAYYGEALAGIEGLVTPTVRPGRRHVWHQYTVRIAPDARLGRDELVDALVAAGVGAGVYYPGAVYDHDCFRADPRVRIDGGCPVAERVATEVVSLPVHQHLTDADREQVADTVRRLLT
ncbi:DegT/DnrJ/EryC1/StrS family aminotransferase [Actinomarinicola tropica]|uniref:Aminotransferase n=1 Tax=Actinomarinicola tropica TaxID=2789776 RepID=A0A5Q2RPF0_9ACTN|nr:DegT/DnrJ/EryC1/StrS family aminotransferase [Actinomarinicola tropica]QGG95987.1 aminotransferase [Actinomarinicola tropica]